MNCPQCKASERIIKKGFFSRKTGPKARIPRFHCRSCGRHFSTQTASLTEGQRKPELNPQIYALLVSGVSQRRIALLLGTSRQTVDRKLVRLARFAQLGHERELAASGGRVSVAVFDEMETFEHSKCKPLSIAVAVDEASRRVIAARVASMPAKGPLAAIARKKYGRRPDHRSRALAAVLVRLAHVGTDDLLVKSDLCPRYPRALARHLPRARHEGFKGRRGCVVGQGELKAGGFDPLFSLNHSCAMFRDNLKRLSRRTWCTTKRPDRLQCLVSLYVSAHNGLIDHRTSPKPTGRSFTAYLAEAGAEMMAS